MVNESDQSLLTQQEFREINQEDFSRKYGPEYYDAALNLAYGVYYQQNSRNPDAQKLSSYQYYASKLPREIQQKIGYTGFSGRAVIPQRRVEQSTSQNFSPIVPASFENPAVLAQARRTTSFESPGIIAITRQGNRAERVPASFQTNISGLASSEERQQFNVITGRPLTKQEKTRQLVESAIELQQRELLKQERRGTISSIQNSLNPTQQSGFYLGTGRVIEFLGSVPSGFEYQRQVAQENVLKQISKEKNPEKKRALQAQLGLIGLGVGISGISQTVINPIGTIKETAGGAIGLGIELKQNPSKTSQKLFFETQSYFNRPVPIFLGEGLGTIGSAEILGRGLPKLGKTGLKALEDFSNKRFIIDFTRKKAVSGQKLDILKEKFDLANQPNETFLQDLIKSSEKPNPYLDQPKKLRSISEAVDFERQKISEQKDILLENKRVSTIRKKSLEESLSTIKEKDILYNQLSLENEFKQRVLEKNQGVEKVLEDVVQPKRRIPTTRETLQTIKEFDELYKGLSLEKEFKEKILSGESVKDKKIFDEPINFKRKKPSKLETIQSIREINELYNQLSLENEFKQRVLEKNLGFEKSINETIDFKRKKPTKQESVQSIKELNELFRQNSLEKEFIDRVLEKNAGIEKDNFVFDKVLDTRKITNKERIQSIIESNQRTDLANLNNNIFETSIRIKEKRRLGQFGETPKFLQDIVSSQSKKVSSLEGTRKLKSLNEIISIQRKDLGLIEPIILKNINKEASSVLPKKYFTDFSKKFSERERFLEKEFQTKGGKQIFQGKSTLIQLTKTKPKLIQKTIKLKPVETAPPFFSEQKAISDIQEKPSSKSFPLFTRRKKKGIESISFSGKNDTEQKIFSTTVSAQLEKVSEKPVSSSFFRPANILSPRQKTRQRNLEDSVSITQQSFPIIIQEQRIDQVQRQAQRQIQLPKLFTRTRTSFGKQKKISFEEKKKFPVFDFEPGFEVVLFKGGKPLKKLEGSFTFGEAIAKGKREVGFNRLLRSFKVVPSNKPAVRRGITTPFGEKFRFGKRDKSLFVEESASALSSPKEIAQIQFAKRNKVNSLLGGRLF